MTKHQHYDEADLPALTSIAANVRAAIGAGVVLREDVGILNARELDYVKKQVYERKFPQMKILELIPRDSEAPEHAETITYRYHDAVGMAKVIANYADDLPRVDVTGKEQTVKVYTVADSYGYNYRELAASVATGANLPIRKAEAARRAVEIKLNKIALFGDAAHNIYGLANHPNIGVTTLPSQKNWLTDNPTAEELLADVNAMYDAVLMQSKNVHMPNAFLLSIRHASILKRKTLPDSGGKTVWQRLHEDYPDMRFVELAELGATGFGGRSKMFMGEFDANNLHLDVPQAFMQHPAEQRGLEIVVACTATTAGLVVHYPLALTYAEA